MSSSSNAAASDAALGERIAHSGKPPAVAACIGCHGARGEGIADFPRLAASGRDYLLRQLQHFADGSRQNPVMQPIAAALSAAERTAVTDYFANLPNPWPPETGTTAATTAATPPTPADRGAWLWSRGRWSEQLPACAQCHGPDGEGVGGDFPPLMGLSAQYLNDQIRAWNDGKRPPGPLGLMGAIAKKLDNDDLTAIAAHLVALRGQPPATAAAATAAAPGSGSESAAPQAAQPLAGAPTAAAGSSNATAGSAFQPPAEETIPATPMGDVIRRGEQLFVNTQTNATKFVGNALNCVNCHLDAGRLANSAPLWGAYPLYPAYRGKTRHVDTFAERLRGCFQYSMNGTAPPHGDEVLVALEAYSYWMATGAPIGAKLPGSGYPKVARPAAAPDFARGRAVFEAHCALCHGADGQGRKSAAGAQVFPPLWGARSYNWGAGMHEVDKAAAFIQANMPYGLGGTLSDQDAWDVATFMNSHERPQDPRFTGDVAETRKRFHDSEFSLYGTTVEGKVLGVGAAK